VILIAASILAARKLAQLGPRPSPAVEACISDAITTAEKILQRIDARWPTERAPSQRPPDWKSACSWLACTKSEPTLIRG